MKDYGTLRRHTLALPFELVMAGGIVVTFAKGDQLHLLTSVFTLLISFLPLVLERWLQVRLPLSVQTAYVAFIFASMFAGEVLGMYSRVWLWDDWMHLVSGVLIGIGVVLWLAFMETKKLQLPQWLQGYLILGSAAFLAVIWELAEFASDQLFGTFSQGGDLVDTMLDLLDDLSGAAVVAVIWRLTTAQNDPIGLRRFVTGFVKLQH